MDFPVMLGTMQQKEMGTCYQPKMRLLPVIAMIKVEIIATSLSQILIAQVQGQAQQMLSLELRGELDV